MRGLVSPSFSSSSGKQDSHNPCSVCMQDQLGKELQSVLVELARIIILYIQRVYGILAGILSYIRSYTA